MDSATNYSKELLRNINQPAFLLDKKGTLVFLNDYFQKMLALKNGQSEGRPLSTLVVENEKNKIEKLIGRTGNIPSVQTTFIAIDKLPISFRWKGFWNEEGAFWSCVGKLAKEQTAESRIQNQYEKKLKEYNRRLTTLVERIGEGFVALDEEGRVIYWNQKAELISGRRRDEVLARIIWECYPEMATPEFCSFYSKAIELQTHQEYEAFYKNEQKWIKIILHPGNNGVTAFFRDITGQKKIEQELQIQKKQRTKEITAAVIQAQEKERMQISQELHDNVNQVLTTVKLYTELCINDLGNKELMQRSMQLLQGCINEIRSLSKQLSAPSLGKIGLKDSLKDLVRTMTATGKTSIRLDTKGIRDIKVSNEMHLAIYRIVQEHLTNILKHANAKTVRIVISYVDDDIVLKIADDGKGFNVNAPAGGIGIANMKSRAESLGGKLGLNSAPGLGCVLIAHFPKKG